MNESIRYEADDACPPLVSLGVGLQGAIFGLAPLVLIVAITARAGGQDESYLSWAVFAALIIAGCLTALQASRIWRLWSPIIGIGIGCVVAALFGSYEIQRVIDAAWFGTSEAGFSGFDLTPDASFWALLPVFVVVMLVGGIKNIGDSVAKCRACHRRGIHLAGAFPEIAGDPVDHPRSCHGSVHTDGDRPYLR